MRTWILIASLGLGACRSEAKSKEPEATVDKAAGDVERAASDVGDAVGTAAERAREVGRDVSESVGRTVDDALGTPREPPPAETSGEGGDEAADGEPDDTGA